MAGSSTDPFPPADTGDDDEAPMLDADDVRRRRSPPPPRLRNSAIHSQLSRAPPSLAQPIMDRIQWALHKQLKGSYDVARMTLSEQTELSRAKAAREDIGVQLYQMQQQLAKLQMNLEKVHENHSIIAQMREAAEDDQRKVREAYKQTYGEVSGQRQKVAKHQAELDQLAATLRQVEAYNEQMRSEIAVTRRATYKAEEAITQLEGGKVQQDVLIDAINEKLKRSQEQLALYEAQLLAQQQETGAAGNTLKEASAEMEAIHFEKKQLLSQWKTALIGMGRRDEALQGDRGGDPQAARAGARDRAGAGGDQEGHPQGGGGERVQDRHRQPPRRRGGRRRPADRGRARARCSTSRRAGAPPAPPSHPRPPRHPRATPRTPLPSPLLTPAPSSPSQERLVMLARSLEQTEAELMKAARARDVVVKEVRQLEEQWERVSRQANATRGEAQKTL